MREFLDDNFLLDTASSERLFHDHAKKMPIFDYHCHLIPSQISENKRFANLTQIWLYGDHYKWRVMRANGVQEKYCTGSATDREKFDKWAMTMPMAIGNPVYHWSHMELKDPFGIKGMVLAPETAEQIWNRCNEQLATEEFRVHGLLDHFNVKCVCTTDDPADKLEHHKAIAASNLKTKVLPAYRPDKAAAVDNAGNWKNYIETLSAATGIAITSYYLLLDALEKSHTYFHQCGCRIADHGIYLPVFRLADEKKLSATFKKAMSGKRVSTEEAEEFTTAVLLFTGRLHAKRDWTMQLHMGALRSNNTRQLSALGPDTGYDCIADGDIAWPLARFLDELDKTEELPKTILYTLNPRDNELLVTLAGCFQDGKTPGKIQFGSGWWFNDQKDGMIRQMISLSHMGLLSRFVGMLTDSRSFLSYPRHEYFRRILCNLIGTWVEKGEIPSDMSLLGKMVEDISYNNARDYFGIPLD